MEGKRPVRAICILVVFAFTQIFVLADGSPLTSGASLTFDFLFTDPALIVSTPERHQFLLVPDLIDGRVAVPELLPARIKTAIRMPPQNCEKELEMLRMDHCRRGFSPTSRFNQLGYVPFVEVGRSAFVGHAIVIEPRHQRCVLTTAPVSSKSKYNRQITMDTSLGDLRLSGKLNGKETVFRVSFDSNTFLGISPATKDELRVQFLEAGTADSQVVFVNGMEAADAIVTLTDESSTLPVLGMDFIRRFNSNFSFSDIHTVDWEFNDKDLLTSLPVSYRRQFELASEQDGYRVTQVNPSFALAGLMLNDRFLADKTESVTVYVFAERIAKLVRSGNKAQIERNGNVETIAFDSSKLVTPHTSGLSIEF